MSRIYVIRHVRPSTGWGGADDDPGLDDVGKAQADAAARQLLAQPAGLRAARVISSPLRRCRETAAPFAAAIGVGIEIEPAVAEIPTPVSLAPSERGSWLRRAFAGSWSEIEGELDYEAWRREVIASVASRPGAAIFTHFVAINALVTGLAREARTIGFRPDHVSISSFEIIDGGLRLVALGREAATQVA